MLPILELPNMITEISTQANIMLKSPQRSYPLRGEYMPDWPSYSIKEASQKTGYNEEYLRRLIRQGKVEAIKVGPAYLIRAESLEKYIAEMQDSEDARTGPREKSE
jgi:excisionase family DNA binding protein